MNLTTTDRLLLLALLAKFLSGENNRKRSCNENEKPELKEGDYLKNEDGNIDFTKGKTYRLGAKVPCEDGTAFRIEGDKYGTWYITIDENDQIVMDGGREKATFSKVEKPETQSTKDKPTPDEADEPIKLKEGDWLSLKRIDGDVTWIERLTVGKKYPIKRIDHDGDVIVENDIGNYVYCAGHTLENGEIKAGFGAATAIFEKTDAPVDPVKLKAGDLISLKRLEGPAAGVDGLTLGNKYHIDGVDFEDDAFFDDDDGDTVYLTGDTLENGEIKAYINSPTHAVFEKVEADEDEPLIDRLLKLGPHRAWIDDDSEEQAREDKLTLLVKGKNENGWYRTEGGFSDNWKYAVPVNAQGEEVTCIEDADPVKPEPLIDRLLKDGPHYAKVDDDCEDAAAVSTVVRLITRKGEDGWYVAEDGEIWYHAVPVDARGNIIKE